MSDLISRAEAIKGVKELFACADIGNDEHDITYMLENLPSTDRPTGEWVRKYDKQINCYWYECNQCGEYRPRNVFGKEWGSPYCPNCGARMYKGGESNG